MKTNAFLLAAAVGVFLLLGHIAANESAAKQEDAEAISSRDFAASKVCQGMAFEWHGDVLTCYKEMP